MYTALMHIIQVGHYENLIGDNLISVQPNGRMVVPLLQCYKNTTLKTASTIVLLYPHPPGVYLARRRHCQQKDYVDQTYGDPPLSAGLTTLC